MRLQEIKQTILEQELPIEELCGMLEISSEEILDRFTDKLMESSFKFGIADSVGELD